MKKLFLLFTFIGFTLLSNAQTPLLIESDSDGFGEIFINNTTLIRSGLRQEAATIAIDDANFPVTVVASGPLTATTFLRGTLNEDATQLFLADIDGQLWQTALNTGQVETFAPVGTFNFEIIGLDYYNGRVYFTTLAPQIISFDPVDPDNSIENFYDSDAPFPIINTEIIGDFLYYSTQSSFDPPITYQIFRLDLRIAFQEPELVTTTPNRVFTITNTGDYLYLGSDVNNAVYRANISGALPANSETVFNRIIPTNQATLFSLVHDGTFIYFSTDNGLYRIADPLLGIPSNAVSEITVYPNPAKDFIYFNGGSSKLSLIHI